MTSADHSTLCRLYARMYQAMIAKDIATLEQIMAPSSALIHMTGLRQPRSEFLQAIANGTLNYFSCTNSRVDVEVAGNQARMTGRSLVAAAVFGGGRHTWPLQLDILWQKVNGQWLITQMRASTY